MAEDNNSLSKIFEPFIKNYIYIYHLDKFFILPSYPESIQDSLNSTFGQTNILARTAPIFSYSYSGPRTVQISIPLHRDLMQQLNTSVSNVETDMWEDYVDTLIKYLQAIALPKYSENSKMINPPMVAIRFGDDLFIKGVVNGGVTTTYDLPLLSNGKYAKVTIGFQISEVDPYDAETVLTQGSLRGLSPRIDNRNPYHSLYK